MYHVMSEREEQHVCCSNNINISEKEENSYIISSNNNMKTRKRKCLKTEGRREKKSISENVYNI